MLLAVQREGAVTGLLHIFPQASYPFPTETVRNRWLAEIGSSDVDCFAIMEDERVAGYAATRAQELVHFGTAPQTWGSGLAGQAHDEVVAHLRADGHHTAWLNVLEQNERAIRFYGRRGWVPTGLTSREPFPPHPTLCRYERTLR